MFEENRQLSQDERSLRQQCYTRLASELKQRAACWKQRAKIKAVREGDSNTAFFHAHATTRFRKNSIRSVEVDGVQVTNQQVKVQALTDYFKSIIGTSGRSVWHFDCHSLYQQLPRATDALTDEFTEQEAIAAVKSMNRCSAPGPDGFGPSFYKTTWPTVRTDVMNLLHAFHSETVQLERLNRSYMVLIPKKPNATEVHAFRPICLQNCSIKTITKILTTRLQTQIKELVDLDQTGFIQGRSITENFVYAMELVQHCHKRRKPTLVIKLDFAKAFDTLSWAALDTVMEARGFNQKWRRWMFTILQSSKSAVLVNGCPGPWIRCKRGLRQGDPISPYLFILVADVLQVLIRNDPRIRHPIVDNAGYPVLQYADDTLLLVRGELEDVQALKVLLDQFVAATGLQINYTKSTAVLIFMEEAAVTDCVSALGCRREGFPQTYLGLPLSNTKLRLKAFAPQIAKADKYLAGWQASILNHMGRTTLVNSVLDCQLVYAMCALEIPPGVVE
jgi:mannosylglycoprotein endo-beta-mannosidase